MIMAVFFLCDKAIPTQKIDQHFLYLAPHNYFRKFNISGQTTVRHSLLHLSHHGGKPDGFGASSFSTATVSQELSLLICTKP